MSNWKLYLTASTILEELGYIAGPAFPLPALREAMGKFQAANGLPVRKAIDGYSVSELQKIYLEKQATCSEAGR